MRRVQLRRVSLCRRNGRPCDSRVRPGEDSAEVRSTSFGLRFHIRRSKIRMFSRSGTADPNAICVHPPIEGRLKSHQRITLACLVSSALNREDVTVTKDPTHLTPRARLYGSRGPSGRLRDDSVPRCTVHRTPPASPFGSPDPILSLSVNASSSSGQGPWTRINQEEGPVLIPVRSPRVQLHLRLHQVRLLPPATTLTSGCNHEDPHLLQPPPDRGQKGLISPWLGTKVPVQNVAESATMDQ